MRGRRRIMILTKHVGSPERASVCPHLIDTHLLQSICIYEMQHPRWFCVQFSRARHPRASHHRFDAEAIRSSSASSPSRPKVTLRSAEAMLRPPSLLPRISPSPIDVLLLLKCLFVRLLGEYHASRISSPPVLDRYSAKRFVFMVTCNELIGTTAVQGLLRRMYVYKLHLILSIRKKQRK